MSVNSLIVRNVGPRAAAPQGDLKLAESNRLFKLGDAKL